MSTSDLKKQSFLRVALLISLYFLPEPGGGANTALNRASILKKMGYSVFVLCGFPSYPSGRVTDEMYKGKLFCVEKIGDFTLIRLRLLPLESKGYLRRLILFMSFNLLTLIWMPRILRICSGTELVYALAPILFSSFIGFGYSKITRSFFIYEVSAFWPEELVALNKNLNIILIFFGKTIARISYSLPDMLVVISNLAAKYIADNYRTGVRIHTMHIGVDPSRYPLISKEYSRKRLIEEKMFPPNLLDKFIVLYSGVITKITKVENMIYAADKLRNNGNEKEIVFLIIGEGEEKSKIEQTARSRNLNNIFILPFQPANLVPYMISAADVCVVPLSSEPIYETTVPTKFYDYLACHKSQIGICAGELAEIINSNHIGITVNEGDIDKLVEGILTLKNSPSLTEVMEKNTHAVLEVYSLDTLALRLDKVLRKEISQKKKSNG